MKCKCGCGKTVNQGKTFIQGHNGRVPTKETRLKKSKSLMGHLVTTSTRNKIRKTLLGHQVSTETRNKISNTLVHEDGGPDHPYMALRDLNILIEEVKIRDEHKCIRCRKKKNLVVHHVIPVRVASFEKLCDHESNLVTLCRGCHSIIEPRRKEDGWKYFVSEMISYLRKFKYKKYVASKYVEGIK